MVDASNEEASSQMLVVYDTLRSLDVVDKDIITVFNKTDLTDKDIIETAFVEAVSDDLLQ